MKIKEALECLESAAAEGSNDLKEIFLDDYKNLRKMVVENFSKNVDYTISKAKVLNRSIHECPWYYIGGTALLTGSLVLLLCRDKK